MRLFRLASLLAFSTFTFLCASSSAYGVEGTVVDPSGWAIRNAEVKCGQSIAASGIDGRFKLPGVEGCQVSVSAPGFQTAAVELSSGGANRIALAIAGVVERVVVTATRDLTTAEEAGVAASVITRAEIERRQFPEPLELLREVPGLAVASTGRQGAQTSLFTRGAQRTATLVLLDGVPMNDPGGEINFGQLASSDIERIEVVRGPGSAVFGAEASAGVVQMFTRRGDPERRTPRGSVSYERGSFQSDRWIANLNGGSGERLDYSLNASQFHTAGEFPNDAFRSTTGSANVGYLISPKTQIRGVFRSFDTYLGVPGQVAYGLIDRDARQNGRDSSLSLRLDDARTSNFLQRVSFGYHRGRSVYIDTEMDGPYTLAMLARDEGGPARRVHRVSLVDPRRLPLPASEIPSGTRLITQDVLLFPSPDPYITEASRKRFNYQGTVTHGRGSTVFGYDYERQEGDVSGRGVSRNNNGVFVHEQYSLGSRLLLAGGLRVENSSVFGTRVIPRGAASLALSGEHGALSSTILRVSAGRGIVEPSLIQHFSREAFFVGNPELRPEQTNSYEAGIVQEWFGRRLRTEVAAFHNSFTDLITFVSLPPPTWGSWENIEASRARGVEVSARAKLSRMVLVSGSYTRLWSRIVHSSAPNDLVRGIGHELTRRPGNSGSLSLSLVPRRWSFVAGAVLAGERQDTDFYGINRNPGYQSVYASGSFRVNRLLTPFLRVENLLNSRYEEVLGYSNLSRTIRGGLRLNW